MVIPQGVPYWRLSAYYFCYFAFLGAFSPYFGLYLQQRGVSAWHVALLLSQMQLMRIVAPMAWGWVADHSGRPVAVVRVSAALSLIGLVAFFRVEGIEAWLLTMALMAFFWSAALPVVEAMTLHHLAAAHGRYPRIRLWGSVGFIAAVLATGALLDLFALAALPGALVAMLAGVLLIALSLPADERVVARPQRVPLAGVLRQRRVRVLLAACFFMSLAHGALYVFYSIYLAEHGYGPTTIGVLWSLGVIAEIAVFLFGAAALRRCSPRIMLAICLAAAALRFAVIGWGVGWLVLLVLAQLLHGLTFGAFHAVSIAAVNRWFPAGCRSRGQAIYSSVSFGAGGLVGGVLAGAMWADVGGAWVFSVSAASAVAGLAVVLGRLLARRVRRAFG